MVRGAVKKQAKQNVVMIPWLNEIALNQLDNNNFLFLNADTMLLDQLHDIGTVIGASRNDSSTPY